ncbi:glycoside hydrolase family 9 protein [Georgenia sp. MJ206]|uniref:glycoside hydrolase family 9 protein n=1 Tax=Georgenia wangjunii TaxID=3117730 RepID=UPI002F268625
MAASAVILGASLSASASADVQPVPDDGDDVLTEWVPGGDFAGEDLGPWFVTGNLADAWTVEDGALCLAVPGGTVNPWDAIVGVNGIPVSSGETYTFSFTASAAPAGAVRALVQQNRDPWPTLFDQTVTPGEEPTTFTWSAVNEAHDWPATQESEAGQVAFQIGGSPEPWTLCLDDVSLTSGGEAPVYEPDTGPRVRVNQHGYLPDGPKRATLVTEATDPTGWELLDDAGAVVASGTSEPRGTDWSSGLDVHVLDFSGTTAEGTYSLRADGDVSHPFTIDADLYQQLRYDALNYFYLARSGIDIEESIAGTDLAGTSFARDAGHLNDPARTRNDTPNRGDYDVPCLTAEEDGASWSYGDWACGDGYALDVVGGWYDAGDHGKYVVNGGISVAQVMSTYERSLYTPTGTPRALGDGALNVPEAANGVSDVLDEARWQLAFLLSMQVPDGTEMTLGGDVVDVGGLVHHKIHDVGWTGIPLMPAADAQERRLHRPSTAATLNLAAVAAQGARLFADVDADFAGELLTAARRAWDAAQEFPDLYAPAEAGNNGGGPYDDTRVSDERYWAAAELYLTTGEPEFERAILENPDHTADVFGAKAFDWRDVAAFARIQLALVPNGLPGRDAVQSSVVAGADTYLAWQAQEAFGTTYPGQDAQRESYEWGSNSMVVNNAIVLTAAFDLTNDDVYRDAAIEALDYLLGRNALNISYVTEYGTVFAQNQHSRWFAAQANPAFPHPPAGSLAGGPNSTVSTWDPTMVSLFGGDNMCTPQMCYVDYYNSWASNEITINWNSALSYLASFLADQGAGAVEPGDAVVRILQHPADVSAEAGETVTFTASATGDPVPAVRWQAWVDGEWVDLDGETAGTLSFAAGLDDDGLLVRAVFTNELGWIATDPAVLAVSPSDGATPDPTDGPTPDPTTPAPDPTTTPPDPTQPPTTPLPGGAGPGGNLPTTGAAPSGAVVSALALVLLGASLALVRRWIPSASASAGRRAKEALPR